jgi:hypothetical protein
MELLQVLGFHWQSILHFGNVRDYGNIYMNPEYLRELSCNPYESQVALMQPAPLCKSGCLAT